MYQKGDVTVGESCDVLGLPYFFACLAPASPYGKSQAARLVPFKPGEEQALEAELNALGLVLAQLAEPAGEGRLLKIRHYLGQLPDWREHLYRVAAGGVLLDAEFFMLKQSLFFFDAIRQLLASDKELASDFSPPCLLGLWQLLDPEETGSPSFYLGDAYSPRLGEVRALLRETRKKLAGLAALGQQEAEKIFALKFNLAGEVAVPRHAAALREQLENSGRFLPSRETYTELYYTRKAAPSEALLTVELAQLKKLENEEEDKVRHFLSHELKQSVAALSLAIERLARLDLVLSKALLARRWQATRPHIAPHDEPLHFTMHLARHPQVADDLLARGLGFTPTSLELSPGVAIITGANMGGKTVALRTVGLLASLAALGMYVPAAYCRTSLFSSTTMLAGEYRASLTGLSRFGHEIVNLSQALPQFGDRALLLIDELASSTNPREGSAIAQAVVLHLQRAPSITLLTTHYDRLAHQEGVTHWQVVGLCLVTEEALREALSQARPESLSQLSQLMDYRLHRVAAAEAHSQEAIRVARFLGLPESIVARALSLLEMKGEE